MRDDEGPAGRGSPAAGTRLVACLLVPLPPAVLERAVDRLPAARARHVRSLHDPRDASRSVLGGLLLDRLVGRSRAVDQGPLGRGRPVCALPGRHVSSSHAGAWVVACGSSSPVGVDVESVSARTAATVARVVRPGERARLRSGTALRSEVMAVRAWTAREAALKRCGLGLRAPLHEMEVVDRGGPGAVVLRPGPRSDLVRFAPLDDHHVLADCGAAPCGPVARARAEDLLAHADAVLPPVLPSSPRSNPPTPRTTT